MKYVKLRWQPEYSNAGVEETVYVYGINDELIAALDRAVAMNEGDELLRLEHVSFGPIDRPAPQTFPAHRICSYEVMG